MCGIVGYIGIKKAVPILMDGLKTLEYRGYDSAGLVSFNDNDTIYERAVGKVAELESKVSDKLDFPSGIGIAHTRWATHGGVTELNAHPHADCTGNIFLAHNGIIENYKNLKSELISLGHEFKSETDSEVLAHMVERVKHDKPELDLGEIVRLVVSRIQGTYGIVVVDRNAPTKLVVARNFSPLVLGIGKDELMVASDAAAVLRLTANVVYLNDGEIAVLEPPDYRIFNIHKEQIKRTPEVLDWDVETAKKGKYPHFMLKEIHEEPDAVINSMRGRTDIDNGTAVLGGLASVESKLAEVEKIHIGACGTAYLAGLTGKYMLEEYAGLPAEIDFASEIRYRKPIFGKNDAFIAISQSGETADTLAGVYEAKQKNTLALGIVNVVGSTISRETDAGVYQHVGPEIGVASTKAFVSQLTILALLTVFLGRKRSMSLVMGKRILEELTAIPKKMQEVLDGAETIKALASKYSHYKDFFYLGRKYNYPIAVEGALKIKEISYVHAEGYASGEMKHGPIALIDENFPSVVVIPQDSVYEKNFSNIEEIKARGGPVLAIATEGDKKVVDVADDVIYIPKSLEMLTPLIVSVPLHLFAYYVGVEKGLDVDKPRNLAKSVTVE